MAHVSIKTNPEKHSLTHTTERFSTEKVQSAGRNTVRKPLTTGITGQDGSFLAELLLDQGKAHGGHA